MALRELLDLIGLTDGKIKSTDGHAAGALEHMWAFFGAESNIALNASLMSKHLKMCTFQSCDAFSAEHVYLHLRNIKLH